MSFLPKDYKTPEKKGGNNYLNKFEEGQTKLRILAEPKIGYEWFSTPDDEVRVGQIQKGDAPVRVPMGITMSVNQFENAKHFWAMPVWNYEEECVQIWKATQFSIQKAIETYVQDEDWGTPLDYDIIIKRKGTGFNDTEYSVIPKPKKEAPSEATKQLKELKIDMDAWMRSEDPFASNKDENEDTDELSDEDLDELDKAIS